MIKVCTNYDCERFQFECCFVYTHCNEQNTTQVHAHRTTSIEIGIRSHTVSRMRSNRMAKQRAQCKINEVIIRWTGVHSYLLQIRSFQFKANISDSINSHLTWVDRLRRIGFDHRKRNHVMMTILALFLRRNTFANDFIVHGTVIGSQKIRRIWNLRIKNSIRFDQMK